MKKFTRFFYLIFILVICGCGGSVGKSENATTSLPTLGTSIPVTHSKLSIPNNRNVEHYKLLFLGNSHVVSNNLSLIVKEIIKQSQADKQVTSELVARGGFLDDRINDGITYETIKNKPWTHIILQGQKVSASQSRFYPTNSTKTWVERVKSSVSATPILFPEHPQKGHLTEAKYIHDIHLGIAKVTPACVAPIGLAWEQAFQLYPSIVLHHPDGNHAGVNGSFLTALVLYQVITGTSIENLPFIEDVNVDSAVQIQLGLVANKAVAENPPCAY